MTQHFQLGVWGRRAAATVTMGDIAGRYTSNVTARLPSAALWSACSLTVTVTFSTCRRSTGALLALKKSIYSCVARRNLRFRSYFVMLAIWLRGYFRFSQWHTVLPYKGIRHPERAELHLNGRTRSYLCRCGVARETSTPDSFRAISQRWGWEPLTSIN